MQKNPNTTELWDKLLFEQNKILLESPFYQDKINSVISFLKKHSGKFLDIGMGSGNLETRILKEKLRLKIYGTDISRKAIFSARKNPKGNFYVSDIFKLPFKASFFDAAAVLDVLEHIYEKDVLNALQEVNRVMKTSGALIVSVPLNENLAKLNKEKRNFNRHLREYTPEILEKELNLAGFEVINRKFIYAFRNFYAVKSFLMKFLTGFRKPNLIIVYATKK